MGGNFSPLEKAATALRGEFEGKGIQILALAGRQELMDTMARAQS